MKRYIIYFFGTDFERVKIGKSQRNLYRRKTQIQNGCPNPIKLLGIINCVNAVDMDICEKELHRRFKKYNTVGEWFRLVPEISTYVENFAESGQDVLESHYQEVFQEYKEYCQNPEVRERRREYDRKRYLEYHQRPEVKAHKVEYHECPEVKARKREKDREYRQRPETRERTRQYNRQWYEKNKDNPEYKAKKRISYRKRNARKRQEQRANNQTLTLPGIE